MTSNNKNKQNCRKKYGQNNGATLQITFLRYA